jgi:predicted heme/steroid binding protein
MNLRRLVYLAALVGFAGTPAAASIAQAGTVYQVTTTDTGVVYFWQRGTRSTQPTCGAGFPGRWAFSSATPAGQSMLALLLSANASGKSVVVAGKASCDVAGDTESVSYIFIAD